MQLAERRRARREAAAAQTQIPADWKPSAAGEAEARRRGYDPVEITADFVLHYRASGEWMSDWEAKFLAWCRREHRFQPERRQGHMPMVISGGKAAAEAADGPAKGEPEEDEPAALVGPGVDAQFARVRRALKAEVGGTEFRLWLAALVLVGVADGVVTLSVDGRFKRDRVASDYGDRVLRLWKAQDASIRRVEVIVAERERRAADG